MADIVNANYAEIYKDVNQVSRPIPTRECSRVMVVHRMYLRLDDLHVDALTNPHVVEELYVFADVVQVEGDDLELPGSRQVNILCRVLRATKSNPVLRFSSLPRVQCQGSGVNMPGSATPQLPASVGMVVTILATHLQLALVGDASARLRVQCPVQVKGTIQVGDMISGFLPVPFDSPGTVEWSISRYDNAAAARSCVITTREGRFSTSDRSWQPSFRVALPEAIPAELLVNSNIVLGIEATTLVSELVLTYQREAIETVAATLHHVYWLDKQLLSASDSTNEQQLHSLHFRVQTLLKLHINTDHDDALIVPALHYDLYDDIISLMSRVAETYDKAFSDFNRSIQQHQVLGEFLLAQNKAFAEKERAMESHHSQLVTLRESELRGANEKLNNLQIALQQQSEAMDKAKDDMEKGVIEYKNRLIADAVLGTITAIFQLAFSFAVGGPNLSGASAAVENARKLSQLANVLQNVVIQLERLVKIKDIINAVTDFLSTLSHLDELIKLPEMPDLPTAAEWDIFENEIEAVAEQMPSEISEAAVWKAKCKNVAALGREITMTVAYMAQVQYELGVNKMLQNVAQKQAERLESLEFKDLDNFLEMASEMDMRTSRMLMGLLNVLSIQTGALSYNYLLPPKPFTGWVTMEAVWNAMLKNQADKLAALVSLGQSSDREMTYVVNGIPVELLLAGEDWIFDIPVHDAAFSDAWSKVRIEYIELHFPTQSSDEYAGSSVHLPTTASGQVYILLQAGRFFDDRLRGDIFHYQAAVPLLYQYAYRLDTGETTISNKPSLVSSTQYMRMTPFTRWRLRLSASAPQNLELAFPTATTPDATTQIAITFHLTVIERPYWRDVSDQQLATA